MKALLRLLLAAVLGLAALGAHAQRALEPGELESLLAPIALYPDPLLSHILDASRYPQDLAAAAAWSRANPQLTGDAALATVQGTAWSPSVKALVAYPDVLARMAESPQWLADLGEAYAYYGAEVMATVQDLRARAHASGYLQSNEQQYVTQQGEAIVVQPAQPNIVYAPWYDPYVVYGGWSWAHRPVFWRPWFAHPHFVTRVIVAPPVRWHVHRPPRVVHPHAPRVVQPHAPRVVQGGPRIVQREPGVRPHRALPESKRPPFVHSGGSPIVRSAPLPAQSRSHPVNPSASRRDGGSDRDGGSHHGFHGGAALGHRR
jgi:hypothetical protein